MGEFWTKIKTMRITTLLIVVLFGLIIVKQFVKPRQEKMAVQSHNWSKLELILEQLELNYVDTIDYKNITEEAIPFILEKLDPHSVYLPPQDLKEADEALEGNFDGIGIQFNVPEDTAIIASIITGGPSEKAGLLPGDRIIKVGGRDVAGVKINQDTLVSLMRGPSGTEVILDIKRLGEKNLLSFPIKRDKIPVKSVDVAYMINDSTGFVKLSKFSRTSYKEFMEGVGPMLEAGVKRIIFDLRDNTGGYFDQALLLANEFLSKGELIVYMEGLHRARQDFHADGRGKLQEVGLSVLINENSASSSEIFAGAIQDNDRGDIIGRRSYGKGLVQEPIYFSDMSGIRLTVARFYTPTGRSIQKPYNGEENGLYREDIIERYRHGEMLVADSIRRNEDLKFTTPKGKTVYGGGGIIPDVFVPIDTTGVSEMFIRINRQSLQFKYSIKKADEYRETLKDIHDLKTLNSLLDRMNLEPDFLNYVKEAGITFDKAGWDMSGDIIMTQIRAYIGRNTPMDDNAFYPIIAKLDNVIQTAIEN